MSEWMPTPIWEGQEAFIIGGGTSLRDFDWSLLKGENTIGCNNAFRLGYDICKICVFVDRKFIFSGANEKRKGFYDELAKFPGLVVTNDTQLKTRPEPWIKWMPRRPKGLHFDALGFNANCGASAINLALLLGSKTVYLLGIDMHLDGQGKPNWHNHLIDKPSEEVYVRMLASFGHVSRDLRTKFPDCKVFNVNRNSNLQVFPKLDPDVFWSERRKNGRNYDTTSVGAGQGNGGSIGFVDSPAHTTVEEDSVFCKVAG
jgi:hypothetical protein